MGTKVTVDDIEIVTNSSGTATTNENFDKVADEFDKVLYRDGSQTLTDNLDADSKRIINLPRAATDGEPITLGQLDSLTLQVKKGDTGPSNNTFLDLTTFKAQPITNGTSSLASLEERLDYVWAYGDYSGITPDDDTYIKADSTDLDTGIWIKKSANALLYSPDANAALRTVKDKLFEKVSCKDYGATGDGTTDDLAAIVAALAVDRGTVVFPKGTYRISGPFEVNGGINLHFETGAKILVDPGVLEVMQIGKTTLFTGSISGDPFIEKAVYEGSTGVLEDIGVAYYNAVSATFYDFEANNFYYPHRLKPQVGQRVGYNLWVHIRGSRGYHNLSADPASTGVPGVTGFINENTFMMGRMFGVDGRTDRQVSFTVGNHNRFYSMCVESPGATCNYGFYLGGHSNLIDSPRNEGTYGVVGIYLAADSISCEVNAWNLYTGITDDGTGNITNSRFNGYKATNTAVVGTAFDWGRTSGGGGAPAFKYRAAATSGDDYGTEQRMSRFTEGSFHFKYVRDSDDLIAFSGNATGNFYAARKLVTGNSSWNIGGLKLGNYNVWFDTNGALRSKNGTPSSATDGSPYTRLVSVPANSSSAGVPGDIAASSSHIYVYTGDGSSHSWSRSEASSSF